jgi:hypothetical protein
MRSPLLAGAACRALPAAIPAAAGGCLDPQSRRQRGRAARSGNGAACGFCWWRRGWIGAVVLRGPGSAGSRLQGLGWSHICGGGQAVAGWQWRRRRSPGLHSSQLHNVRAASGQHVCHPCVRGLCWAGLRGKSGWLDGPWPRSARLISRLKNTVGWFVVREKYCFGWKNKLKKTDYKPGEHAPWVLTTTNIDHAASTHEGRCTSQVALGKFNRELKEPKPEEPESKNLIPYSVSDIEEPK